MTPEQITRIGTFLTEVADYFGQGLTLSRSWSYTPERMKEMELALRDLAKFTPSLAKEVRWLKAERANLHKEMQKLTYSFESRQEMEKIFAKVQNV